MTTLATLLVDELFRTAALSAGMAFAVVVLLRMELGLPYSVGLLVVPSVLGLGFGLAVAVRLWLDLAPLHVAGLLAGGVVALVATYEALKRLSSSPPPPTTF